MMIYLVVLSTKPTVASPEYENLAGAEAHVMVRAVNDVQAIQAAQEYLHQCGWECPSPPSVCQPIDEQGAAHRTDTAAQYQKAVQDGISAVLAASPILERPENILEIRPMKPPHKL